MDILSVQIQNKIPTLQSLSGGWVLLGMILEDEMGRMLKEAAVACAKALSQDLPKWTDKNHSQDGRLWAKKRIHLPNTEKECKIIIGVKDYLVFTYVSSSSAHFF
jgi:hypothetical protein